MNGMKTMKSKSLFLALMLLVASQLSLAAQPVKYRMLLQVSENSVDKLNMALNSAMNVQEIFGPKNIVVELVVFGDGVNTLKYYAPIPIADKVEEATAEGLRIVVCEIAMRSHKLRPSDMLEEVRYVQSGVAELVEKQTEGWSYIRP
jgi:intracellular sulfur oxidation DsrE/DsrF family protein